MRRARLDEKKLAVAPQTISAQSGSIGANLERRRLEHRARRVERAIAALRRLADARAAEGVVPVPLRQAIAGFSDERSQLERRLAEL